MRRSIGLALGLGLTLGSLVVSTALVTNALSTGLKPTYAVGSASPIPVSTDPDTTALKQACHDLPDSAKAVPPMNAVTGTSLRLVVVQFCAVTTMLRSGVTAPLAESADGEWIGYGAGSAVSRLGMAIVQPIGLDIWVRPGRSTWSWSPSGSTMAGITVRTGIRVGAPGQTPRMLLPDGWGATELAFAGPDELIVARGQSLWRVDIVTGQASVIYSAPVQTAPAPIAPVSIAAAATDWVVFWQQASVSAGATDEGAPLLALSLTTGRTVQLASSVIIRSTAVARCGDGVAVSTGAGRDATTGKIITVFRGSDWRARRIGPGVSPSCSAGGRRIAYSSGPATKPTTQEQRDVLVRDLTSARAKLLFRSSRTDVSTTDEVPLLQPDGKALYWVRTKQQYGTLMMASLADTSKVAVAALLDVGRTSDDDGSHDWSGRYILIGSV